MRGTSHTRKKCKHRGTSLTRVGARGWQELPLCLCLPTASLSGLLLPQKAGLHCLFTCIGCNVAASASPHVISRANTLKECQQLLLVLGSWGEISVGQLGTGVGPQALQLWPRGLGPLLWTQLRAPDVWHVCNWGRGQFLGF